MTEIKDSVLLSNTYQKTEIKEAFRFHFSKLLKINRDFFIGFIVSIISLSIISFKGANSFLVIILAIGVLLMLLPVIALYIIPFFESKKLSDLLIKMYFNQDTIECTTNNLKKTYRWKEIFEILENEKFFLLYYGTNQFIIVPKRFFENFNLQANFRKLLKQKVRDFD